MSNRHITINVLPQSDVAWFCLLAIVAVIAGSWGMSRSEVLKAEVEKARIEAATKAK